MRSELLSGLSERLNAAGVPVSRVAVGSGLLHPTFDALGMFWRRGQPVTINRSERLVGSPDDDDGWLRSPWHHLIESRTTSLRRRLDAGGEQVEFPILDQLREEGGTDYLARVEHLGAKARMGELDDIMSSWTTDRPSGFTEGDLALLEQVVPVFAMAYHSRASMITAKTLLMTYLGDDAARRVLEGNIVRGRAEIIRAVVWYSDLANFTRIADEIRHEEVLALLNDYAECLVEILDEAGRAGAEVRGRRHSRDLSGRRRTAMPRTGRWPRPPQPSGRSRGSTRPAASRARPSPTSIWPFMWASCSTAISAAAGVWTSRSWAPRSTRRAASASSAGRSTSGSFSPRRSSRRRPSAAPGSSRSAAMPSRAWRRPRSCSPSTARRSPPERPTVAEMTRLLRLR